MESYFLWHEAAGQDWYLKRMKNGKKKRKEASSEQTLELVPEFWKQILTKQACALHSPLSLCPNSSFYITQKIPLVFWDMLRVLAISDLWCCFKMSGKLFGALSPPDAILSIVAENQQGRGPLWSDFYPFRKKGAAGWGKENRRGPGLRQVPHL